MLQAGYGVYLGVGTLIEERDRVNSLVVARSFKFEDGTWERGSLLRSQS